ncbi:MAG TPA: TetR/AcrR family transcriptional regulator [Bacillus sp. (in: firmicutes)]|uniref:TetR/AcrR family transcriptional regulator n=1 Tax=Bacillus litorisediminis TaxID=2922713 RepID=UPI001FADC020|nr:TetR/AcrR family transcriptional regulator [Bacillus litorisediminis]HWO78410.1 TetR/AcrR family transcriptional regulator [Bacillus sp. (in: firmicutes)]
MQDFIDKRIQRSKTALKQTFIDLLYKKPFAQITISEIVRAANYNRGTFYHNFHTKEELLDEIIHDVLEEMIEEIRKPYKNYKQINIKELNTEDITLFSYFKENGKLFKLLLSNHIRVDFRFQMANAIEDLFITEYEYQLPEGTQLDPRWFYIYRAHGIAGVIIRWIEEDFRTPPEYMAKQIVELMVTSTDVFHMKE